MVLIRLDLNELERELGAETQALIRELANEIVNQFIDNANRSSGDLAASFGIFRRGKGQIWLGSRKPYALPLDTGTGPHTPPFDAIQAWARRELQDESAAGPVFQKIKTEGTDAHPYIEESMQNAVRRVTR